jgi:hypothetical protein
MRIENRKFYANFIRFDFWKTFLAADGLVADGLVSDGRQRVQLALQ